MAMMREFAVQDAGSLVITMRNHSVAMALWQWMAVRQESTYYTKALACI